VDTVPETFLVPQAVSTMVAKVATNSKLIIFFISLFSFFSFVLRPHFKRAMLNEKERLC
jgi:hypothetical protein